MYRKEELAVGEVYHIFTKSIAGFKIFNSETEFLRMRNTLKYYQLENIPFKFSRFMELEQVEEGGFNKHFISISKGKEKMIQIIAHCIMPTHIHLIIKQLKKNGISIFYGQYP